MPRYVIVKNVHINQLDIIFKTCTEFDQFNIIRLKIHHNSSLEQALGLLDDTVSTASQKNKHTKNMQKQLYEHFYISQTKQSYIS